MKNHLVSSLVRGVAIAFLLLVTATLPVHAQLEGGVRYPINGIEDPPTTFASMTSAISYKTAHGVVGSGQVLLEFSPDYGGEPGPVVIPLIVGGAPGRGDHLSSRARLSRAHHGRSTAPALAPARAPEPPLGFLVPGEGASLRGLGRPDGSDPGAWRRGARSRN